MAQRRDNTVFLQDVLSNALIAVLALATVSMVQIAMGGMERYAQAVTGPEVGVKPSGSPPRTARGQPRWEAQVPPTTTMVWILADLPAAAAKTELHAVQGSPTEALSWRAPDATAGRRWELWSLDVRTPPAADEDWVLELADPLPTGESAQVTVLADDRSYTGSDGLRIEGGAVLLHLQRPPRGFLRAWQPEP